MFNKINAEYYGAPTPLQHSRSSRRPTRSLLITPFDRSAIGVIEKAIRDSDLGVNPSNDGNSVRVIDAAADRERARSTSSSPRGKAEDARIAVRTSAATPSTR